MSCSRALELPELLDYIVDFLGDDGPALKACSYVSNAWGTSTARHLFLNLDINPELPRHRIQIAGDDENAILDAAAFELSYTWLVTRHRVVDNVRAIELWTTSTYEYEASSLHPKCASSAFIVDLMATFHRLRSLNVFVYGPLALSTPSRRTPSSPLKLESLGIHCRPWQETLPLQEVLAHVQEVEDLVWGGVMDGDLRILAEEGEAALIPCTKVTESIRLIRTDAEDVPTTCRSLAAFFDTSDVTSILFQEYWPGGLATSDAFKIFCQKHAPRVEHLGFLTGAMTPNEMGTGDVGAYLIDSVSKRRRSFFAAADDMLRFDLSRWTEVPPSIELNIALNTMHRREEVRLWSILIGILLTAPMKSLLHIFIDFTLISTGLSQSTILQSLAVLDWNLLDRILDRQSGLRTLLISFSPIHANVSINSGELEDFVRERLSSGASQLVQFWHL